MTPSSNGPVDPLDRRIGDVERTAALDALGKHLAAGRLDVTEFSDRSGRVATARTGRELSALFDDLPQPHPPVPTGTPPLPPRDLTPLHPAPVRRASAPPARSESRDSVVVGVVSVGALVIFLLLGRFIPMAWLVFLAVPVVVLALRARQSGR